MKVAGFALAPTVVAHADWGTAPAKRWLVRAERRGDRYVAHAPEPVGEASGLLRRLHAGAAGGGPVLVGFDFPIGLPRAYADAAGVTDFLDLLPRLGREEWAAFYDVAERPDEITRHRPFYPRRPVGARLHHLRDALGLAAADDLRRRCEARSPHRRAASPLFWTIGAQQVGKAAIAGWRDVVAPGLRDPTLDLALWPFAGPLAALLRSGRVVVAETYPGEVYHHFGLDWSRPPGRPRGKRSQTARAAHAPALLAWADAAAVTLAPDLRIAITDGFGPSPDGEDPFDAAVGLLGMLNVAIGRRPPGEPADEATRRIEGWILGQRVDG